ncbi:MAG: hypothetical protein PHD07_05015 [Bacteroidales bacterium]|nr:hypothetical protein [Bacteroidales bacterium]MDD3201593.1 hypothetical protein [Bacteroidales bacterium]
MDKKVKNLSDEDLNRVSGGSSPYCDGLTPAECKYEPYCEWMGKSEGCQEVPPPEYYEDHDD